MQHNNIGSGSSLTLDDLRKAIASIPKPPPMVRANEAVAEGTAFRIKLSDDWRRPQDPEELILMHPNDYEKYLRGELP
jgi:hypothetical protein